MTHSFALYLVSPFLQDQIRISFSLILYVMIMMFSYLCRMGKSVGQYMMLQLHVMNMGLTYGLTLNSGFRLHYTTNLASHDMGILQVW